MLSGRKDKSAHHSVWVFIQKLTLSDTQREDRQKNKNRIVFTNVSLQVYIQFGLIHFPINIIRFQFF